MATTTYLQNQIHCLAFKDLLAWSLPNFPVFFYFIAFWVLGTPGVLIFMLSLAHNTTSPGSSLECSLSFISYSYWGPLNMQHKFYLIIQEEFPILFPPPRTVHHLLKFLPTLSYCTWLSVCCLPRQTKWTPWGQTFPCNLSTYRLMSCSTTPYPRGLEMPHNFWIL